jgi:hypothetical protein
VNLYRISRTDDPDWEEWTEAVVAAETDVAARLIHPNRCDVWVTATQQWRFQGNPSSCHSGWVLPADVVVELIGTATPGLEAGVIVAVNRGS